MKNKWKKISCVSFIILGLMIVIGSTYAFVTRTLIGNKQVVVNAGVLDLVLEEENAITISDALPMYDEVGMIQEDVFKFKLINKTSNPTEYVLKLNKINISNLDESLVKYGITREVDKTIGLLSSLTDGIVDRGTIEGNQTINYTLRLWIDSEVTDATQISGKSLAYTLSAEASQKIEKVIYKDKSGANVPQLTSGMIPVVYNETDKTWVKADTSEAWYDYETQMWANAVTVTEATRQTYMDMDTGEPISMDDINTMWVWIPRYEYQYTDLGTTYAGGTQDQPGEIKINFISSDSTTPSDSTKYQIPEGFKFGDENIPGFWMGKFITSTLESCSPDYDNINTECDLLTLTPQIKPNVTAWNGARISTFFLASRLMQSSDNSLNYNANTYGFDKEGISSMDVHMLKNTEWGIVAMLSQSKYGKYGNSNYEGTNKEVYVNIDTNAITGLSNGIPFSEPENVHVTYDTPDTGYGASTTGTIYGVYDMSFPSVYVMVNYRNISGRSINQNSGFCGELSDGTILEEECREWPDTKYFDSYNNLSFSSGSGYKFGDATYETSNWYNDDSTGLSKLKPLLTRGGSWMYSEVDTIGVFGASAETDDNGYFSFFAIKP